MKGRGGGKDRTGEGKGNRIKQMQRTEEKWKDGQEPFL